MNSNAATFFLVAGLFSAAFELPAAAVSGGSAASAKAIARQLHPEGEDRLWLDASINGKPALLAFDSAASDSCLFPRALARLGISFTNAPADVVLAPGNVPAGRTEECDVRFCGRAFKDSFGVIEMPAMIQTAMDGIVGWPALSSNIIRLDACRGTLVLLNDVPDEVANWAKFRIQIYSAVLLLEAPNGNGGQTTVLVDTGSQYGAKLSSGQWRSWKTANPNQPVTLTAYYNSYAGLVVAQEGWATKLAVGPLLLSDVPVMEANKLDVIIGGQVTLGLAALKRLDVLIDGSRGFAYLRARGTPPPPYEHNRLGAVFTPPDLRTDDLIAHVLNGGPAWEAGIRSGDVLRRIGDHDVTKWRTDPKVSSTRFFTRPAGTKLTLTLKRGAELLKVDVVLRDILPPGTNGSLSLSDE